MNGYKLDIRGRITSAQWSQEVVGYRREEWYQGSIQILPRATGWTKISFTKWRTLEDKQIGKLVTCFNILILTYL